MIMPAARMEANVGSMAREIRRLRCKKLLCCRTGGVYSSVNLRDKSFVALKSLSLKSRLKYILFGKFNFRLKLLK
jgi:hypothetical protein